MKTANRIAGLIIGALISASGVMQAGAATLAQFNLDSISNGVTVTDISGNGHDATFNWEGASLNADNPFPGVTFGVPDKSIHVYISDTLAYLAHPETLDLNNGGRSQFTFEGWIKPAVTNQAQTLLYVWDGNGSGTYLALTLTDTGLPVARMYPEGPWYAFAGPDPLPVNQWTHLAMVYNANEDGQLRLYVNATNVASMYCNGASMRTSYQGACFGGGGYGQANGLIDDIRISNDALAPSQFGFHKSFTPPPKGITVMFK